MGCGETGVSSFTFSLSENEIMSLIIATEYIYDKISNYRTDPVGAIPIRQDITVLPSENPRELRLGWRIQEEIGIVVINDYALNRINLTSTLNSNLIRSILEQNNEYY